LSGKRTDAVVVSMTGDRYTPFTLAKKLGAKAILESASFKQGRARYSLVLVDEAFRLRQEPDGVVVVVDGAARPWRTTGPETGREPDILDALAGIAAQNAAVVSPGIPVPASGIGFFGYDFVRRCDKVSIARKEDPIGAPEAEFLVGHVSIVFDHYTDTMHIVALNYDEHAVDLNRRVAEIKKRLADLDFTYLEPPEGEVPFRILSDESRDRTEYMAGVEKIREHIFAGDILQAVLSRRLVAESALEPLEGYRRLRQASPSPYLFYIDFGSYAILGASPESLVRLREGVASIRPIAGTRRRGKDAEEDAALEREMLADPKERSEHLMLVDLARNDLGRACVPGSVRMVRTMEAEHFSHVMHIVSEVEGLPDPGRSPYDLLRAAFPAGTVSGAPKIRAMRIVSELEPCGRSFYAGAVGYLDSHGGFDACITIRSALVKDGKWNLQAGAGIVHGSKPEREWEETNEKLAALRAALTGGAK